MADFMDDLVNIINAGANAYDSYASSKLASANARAASRERREMAVFQDSLLRERQNDKIVTDALEKRYDESVKEIKRLDAEATNLGFDYESYLGTIPENERTQDMLSVFENETDYQNKTLFASVKEANDIDTLKKNQKASTAMNEWKIREIGNLINQYEAGEADAKMMDTEMGIKSIPDYYDYQNKVKEFSDKYLMSEDDVRRFQSEFMGMKEGDEGYGIFGPKTTKAYDELNRGPMISLDAGPDEILGSLDDTRRGLSARGAGLMSGAPTTKEQLQLETALTNLKNKKLTDDAKSGSIDFTQARSENWSSVNSDMRSYATNVAQLQGTGSLNEDYREKFAFDASIKFDKEGGFNSKEDLKQFRDSLGQKLLQVAKWGDDSSLSDDLRKAVIAGDLLDLSNKLIPDNPNDIDPMTGVSKKYSGNLFDFAGFNDMGVNENRHFVENLKMWKKAYDIEGDIDKFELGLLKTQAEQNKRLSNLILPSYSPSEFGKDDIAQLDAFLPKDLSVYDDKGGIDYEQLSKVLDMMKLFNFGK